MTISINRKAEILRNAVLNRLPLPDSEGFALTDEEADFLSQHGEGINGVVARIMTAIDAGAAEIVTGRRLWPRRP